MRLKRIDEGRELLLAPLLLCTSQMSLVTDVPGSDRYGSGARTREAWRQVAGRGAAVKRLALIQVEASIQVQWPCEVTRSKMKEHLAHSEGSAGTKAPSKRSHAHRFDADKDALRLLGAAQEAASRPLSESSIPSVGGHARLLRSLAGFLGNGRMDHLTRRGATQPQRDGDDPTHSPAMHGLDRQPGSSNQVSLESQALQRVAVATGMQEATLVQREARPSNLAVQLSFEETDMQPYELTSETMRELDDELPADVGQFNHSVRFSMSHAETDSGVQVTRVTLPVQYNYVMPEWTRLSEQPPAIQQAWQRFYADVLTHEQEHLSVSRRYYTQLRQTLEALPPDERTETRVEHEIDLSIQEQNETHRLHTGFVTPATIVFSRYIPESDQEDQEQVPSEGEPE